MDYEGVAQIPPYITSLWFKLGVIDVGPYALEAVLVLAAIDDFPHVSVHVATGQTLRVVVLVLVVVVVVVTIAGLRCRFHGDLLCSCSCR